MNKHKWTEEEDKIAFYAYRFLSEDETNKIANKLPMSNDSFLMRIQNYKFLDTGEGLRNYSKQSERIYKKYENTSQEDFALKL
jgi:hypothetical protein